MYRYTGVVASGTPYEARCPGWKGRHRDDHPVDITTAGANRRVIALVAEGKSFALGDFTGGTASVPEETPEATPSLGAGALGINGLTRTSAGLFDFGIYTLSLRVRHTSSSRSLSFRPDRDAARLSRTAGPRPTIEP